MLARSIGQHQSPDNESTDSIASIFNLTLKVMRRAKSRIDDCIDVNVLMNRSFQIDMHRPIQTKQTSADGETSRRGCC
jgi:hypothetical protein